MPRVEIKVVNPLLIRDIVQDEDGKTSKEEKGQKKWIVAGNKIMKSWQLHPSQRENQSKTESQYFLEGGYTRNLAGKHEYIVWLKNNDQECRDSSPMSQETCDPQWFHDHKVQIWNVSTNSQNIAL